MNYDKLLLSTLSQDAFYLVNKELVRKLGVIPSLTISLLIDKYKYFKLENKLDAQGGFFLSAKKTKKQINIIEQELGIARSARRTSFGVLKKYNLVKIIKKGNPAQYHYYINFKSVLNILSSGDESTPLSEVETNLSSGDESTPLYNKNKEQKQNNKNKEQERAHEKIPIYQTGDGALNFYNVDVIDCNIIEQMKKPSLTESLKEIAGRNNLAYSIDNDNERIFQNKLTLKMSLTNDRILDQAKRFETIVKKEPTLCWTKNDSFGFKFLQFNWGKIDAWHSANKPQVVEFKKPKPKAQVSFSNNDMEKMAGFLK